MVSNGKFQVYLENSMKICCFVAYSKYVIQCATNDNSLTTDDKMYRMYIKINEKSQTRKSHYIFRGVVAVHSVTIFLSSQNF